LAPKLLSLMDWCKIALNGSKHGKTEVTQLYTYYPFRLIQQSPWKSYVCMVGVGFGGGLVQGDVVNLNLDLQNGAEAW